MPGYKLHSVARFESRDGGTWRAARLGDPNVSEIQEVYFSWINPGCIKAWKRHKVATCNFVVPVGNVEFAVQASNGHFEVVTIGVDNYCRLVVFPDTWFGFKGIADQPSLVVNTMNHLHDDQESEKADINLFDHDWTN